jgi:tRNA-uridine 2-sulfurtransferase
MSGLKVLAAMSGGVDSATAAARVVDAGHEVTGVHLALSANPKSYRTGARGCCTLEDARDARRAADVIGIPFYVWDLAERFHRDVVEDFVAEYAAGRTPNPCLRCNEKIKFTAVLDRALALGFDAVCTGHYARIRDGILHRAADPAKDQSYVLAVLTSAQLSHAMFPLGDTLKDQVRAEAARRGLAVADKPDSHDVCFIADGDTKGFLAGRLGREPGPIVDESGAVLGEHDGAYAFTVGQRRGLRVGQPAADGRPRYVLDIEPVTRTVTVGSAEGLEVSEITAERPVWTGCVPPLESLDCLVQLRAHGDVHPCTAWLDADMLRIRLHRPARGVAKGQAAVMYAGDAVLGSATISGTSSAALAGSRPGWARPANGLLVVSEEVPVQLPRAGRFWARLGVIVHNRYDPQIGL